jgi:hypothetical protein
VGIVATKSGRTLLVCPVSRGSWVKVNKPFRSMAWFPFM